MDFFFPIDDTHPGRRFIKSNKERLLNDKFEQCITKCKLHWLNRTAINIPNEHPLVRAIKGINAITDDLYRAYGMAVDQMHVVGSGLNWFNSTGQGKFLEKPYFFLDKDTPDAIILVNRDESRQLVHEQYFSEGKNYWSSWEPIRVKHHCYTDMDYWPMCRKYGMERRISCFDGGVNIIEVDLPLLYTQFRYWLDSDLSKVDGILKPISDFLMTYPIANAIGRQMQIAYFNRVRCIWLGLPIKGNRDVHGTQTLPSTYQNIDESIIEIEKNFKRSGGINFDVFIKNFPSLGGADYEEIFSRSEVMPWSKNEMIQCIGLLALYETYISLVYKLQQDRWNTKQITKLKYGIRQIFNRNLFSTINDNRVYKLVHRFKELDDILHKRKKLTV